MENKELDQFMRDYFKQGEQIAVDCNWLQKTLREIETLKRVNRTISERLCLIEAIRELKTMEIPEYRLNISV